MKRSKTNTWVAIVMIAAALGAILCVVQIANAQEICWQDHIWLPIDEYIAHEIIEAAREIPTYGMTSERVVWLLDEVGEVDDSRDWAAFELLAQEQLNAILMGYDLEVEARNLARRMTDDLSLYLWSCGELPPERW